MATTSLTSSPNAADLTDAQRARAWLVKHVFGALVALQLIATLRNSWVYFELTRTGVAPLYGLVFGLAGNVCLYVGAVALLFKGQRATRLFLAASIALVVSLRAWGWPYSWTIAIGFGALLAIAGWWIASRRIEINAPFALKDRVPTLSDMQPRPLSVFVLALVCLIPISATCLFVFNNWAEFVAQLKATPVSLVELLTYPLLVMSGGLLLFNLRKESIVVFAVYLFWGIGHQLTGGRFNVYKFLDIFFAIGIVIYCLRLMQRNLLR